MILILLLVTIKKTKPNTTSYPPTSTYSEYVDTTPTQPSGPYTSPIDKQAYMRSEQWNIKRKTRLNLDDYTCQSCGISGVPLDVHHLTYKNIFNEDMSDLISLCRTCHTETHDRTGYSYEDDHPIKE